LVAALRNRESGALQRFLGDGDFPLVEEDTVTFVYPAEEEFDEIFLIHWVFGLESRQPLSRLAGTDLWYLTLELPHGSRVEYKFELTREGRRFWVRDPLNPRRAHDPFGANSVCPMTGYVDPEWARPDPSARAGTVERISLPSTAYGDQREVAIYLPAEFRPTRRYSLLICHDGDDWMHYGGLIPVLDNLIHRHEVIPLIVAMTNGVSRNEEYAANALQARFLTEDLLPYMCRRFKIADDPRRRGLMGASFGAVSSLHCAFENPGMFGRLLLNSGSFVFTDIGWHDRGSLWDPVVTLVNRFREEPQRLADSRLFLSCGVHESLITFNRSLVPLLRAAELDFRFVESRDGHNWIGWRDRLRDGLTWLFPGHLRMTYE